MRLLPFILAAALAAALVALPPAVRAGERASAPPVELPPIPSIVLPATIEPVTLPAVTTFTLDNGLEVVIVERHDRPLAFVLLSVPAGTVHEEPDHPGVASLTASMLTKGTRTRSAVEIARTIESVGGQLSSSADVERARIQSAVLASHLPLAMELVADVVQNPTFPAPELALLRQQAEARIRQQFDDPGALAGLHANQLLYGNRHPLGHFPTPEEVQSITSEELASFHRTRYGPQGSRLLVAGDVDPQRVAALARTLFGGWRGEGARPALPGAPALDKPRVRFVEWPGQTQVRIELRQSGPPATVDDWLAVSAYNYILGGGGFASRLMEVVRARLGQTYDVHTFYGAYGFPSHFGLSSYTRSEEIWTALDVIRAELQRFHAEGVTAEELAQARQFFILGYPMALETLADITLRIDTALALGRGLEWVSEYPVRMARLSVDDVNAAIRRYFDPDRFAIVLLGDPKVLDGAPELVWGVPKSQIERVGRTEVPKP